MKSEFLHLLLLFFLILATESAFAEGNCPAGYYPIGAQQGQQGPQGCAPIPSDGQQQEGAQFSPHYWASHWGAIATDGSGGSFGASTDLPTQKIAEHAALADCHSKKGSNSCAIEIVYVNQCAAMVAGDVGYNTKAGLTIDLAVKAAMKVCSASDTHCYAYYTGCSLPTQIQ